MSRHVAGFGVASHRHAGGGHSARHRGAVAHVRAHKQRAPYAGHASAGKNAAFWKVPARFMSDAWASRINLDPRYSGGNGAFMELALIQSYNGGANTAMVSFVGSPGVTSGPIAVNKALAPALAVAGARCMVVVLDANNPSDGMITAIW
jgi:hypothetical protein